MGVLGFTKEKINMVQKIKKGFRDYMNAAMQEVDIVDIDEAMQMAKESETQFVDVRDRSEVHESGKISGAENVSRGMLEFVIDPDSPYHNKIFTQDKKFVFYCASGGRSTLAAHRAKEMGLDDVCTLSGGFKEWQDKGGDIEKIE